MMEIIMVVEARRATPFLEPCHSGWFIGVVVVVVYAVCTLIVCLPLTCVSGGCGGEGGSRHEYQQEH